MLSIYLVDDDPLILKNLSEKAIWQECGFEVCGTSHAPQEALQDIVHLQPDAVMCDLKMPGLDGVSLMAQAKNQGVDSAFIMLSAFASFQDSRDFFTNQGFDYLLKPVDEMELQITLERLARRLIKKNGPLPQVQVEQASTIDAIMNHIRRNYTQKITLNQLAELFHLNPNYIGNLFVKHYGQTFTSIVTSLRLNEALRLMENTTKPLKAIAADCGYPNYFYFCRVFKEHYGCTPGDYVH
ncbi:helix-turn-helix domain-containing protein [Clostridia bacterium OttesenSCG-928-O13]|nr:helix-turn-helix domain-containing protein [Clostridia bacterium OttesenSCG-928-O13]